MVTQREIPDWDPSSPAPGGLEFVRQFANTLDCYRYRDDLADIGHADARMRRIDPDAYDLFLPPRPHPMQLDDLIKLRSARAALRATLGCMTRWTLPATSSYSSKTLPPPELSETEPPEFSSPCSLELSDNGVQFVPDGGWANALTSWLSLELLVGTRTGEVARLKVCANPECQWVFWDASRPGTGRWCSMRLCGGQAKARRYREKRGDSTHG
ncbi:CGNR zinc finger domain-containing protein [Brevibacterium aurantiacum]|uniref:CGNR zinc finger domain-containing protein n=1 Tax=Brevibacterium aurantiacum TaxID=273384 RepID=A0A556C3Y6_BREAU|nr:CGNR zinc finger domain-containing protein [Brevibacterium aurantiacum]TSI12121.1 CGNR zinc finger domain-containing protein [Brevibacterium aurantiacum]